MVSWLYPQAAPPARANVCTCPSRAWVTLHLPAPALPVLTVAVLLGATSALPNQPLPISVMV